MVSYFNQIYRLAHGTVPNFDVRPILYYAKIAIQCNTINNVPELLMIILPKLLVNGSRCYHGHGELRFKKVSATLQYLLSSTIISSLELKSGI